MLTQWRRMVRIFEALVQIPVLPLILAIVIWQRYAIHKKRNNKHGGFFISEFSRSVSVIFLFLSYAFLYFLDMLKTIINWNLAYVAPFKLNCFASCRNLNFINLYASDNRLLIYFVFILCIYMALHFCGGKSKNNLSIFTHTIFIFWRSLLNRCSKSEYDI